MKLQTTSRGFSLIELLVVLGLMLLIASISMLSFQQFNQTKIQNVLSEIGFLLEQAQVQTMATRKPVRVGFSSGEHGLTIIAIQSTWDHLPADEIDASLLKPGAWTPISKSLSYPDIELITAPGTTAEDSIQSTELAPFTQRISGEPREFPVSLQFSGTGAVIIRNNHNPHHIHIDLRSKRNQKRTGSILVSTTTGKVTSQEP